MDNFISVIITVYKRKEFYKEAIESALNQTLDKKYYEIIVVHYIDIDRINYENVRYIQCDDLNIGAQLAIGIENAKGNIISFLDDDDKFLPEKLEFVYNTFKDSNVVYLHNSFITNIPNFKNNDPFFNMSCISIRKEIINKNIDKINTLPDLFMYYSALNSKKRIILSEIKLTFYRFHKKNVSIPISLDNRIKIILSYSDELLNFLNWFENKKVKNLIKVRLTHYNIFLELHGIHNNQVFLFTYLFSNEFSIISRIKGIAAYILYKHKIFNKYIINKIRKSDEDLIKRYR